MKTFTGIIKFKFEANDSEDAAELLQSAWDDFKLYVIEADVSISEDDNINDDEKTKGKQNEKH